MKQEWWDASKFNDTPSVVAASGMASWYQRWDTELTLHAVRVRHVERDTTAQCRSDVNLISRVFPAEGKRGVVMHGNIEVWRR